MPTKRDPNIVRLNQAQKALTDGQRLQPAMNPQNATGMSLQGSNRANLTMNVPPMKPKKPGLLKRIANKAGITQSPVTGFKQAVSAYKAGKAARQSKKK